jgi:tetratricopeptide (TPR) repeat protein
MTSFFIVSGCANFAPVGTPMKNKCSLWIVVSLLSIPSFSQDSLVSFKDLKFQSSFEEQAFRQMTEKHFDMFSLFMANGGLLTESKINERRTQFYSYIEELAYQKLAGKKVDKRIKPVYDALHKRFLTKYEEKNSFEEIFYNGYYNCVSASALYALAFDKMQIPYAIKEEPTHVYLVAYPGAEQVVLQTTLAIGGARVISNEFKQQFVKILRDQKLISAKEFSAQDVNTLFDQYYFGANQDITLTQLAGIQYFNDGVLNVEQKNYEEAIIQLQKAYYLYSCERFRNTLFLGSIMSFSSHVKKDSAHAVKLGRLTRFKSMGIENNNIVSEFGMATQELLNNSATRDIKSYDDYHRLLVNELAETDTVLINDISFIYHYEKARSFFNRGKFKESLQYIERALELRSDDEDTQAMLTSTIGNILRSQNDPKVIESTLEGYAKRFPGLLDNNTFNEMRATTYLMQFNIGYTVGKIAEAERYRGLYEQLSDKYDEMSINTSLIGQAYSTAAVYHFKKGQVSKARQYINTGLKYAPGSYELITRQQMIH